MFELQMYDPSTDSWALLNRYETVAEARKERDFELDFHPELVLTDFQIIDTKDGDWRPVS